MARDAEGGGLLLFPSTYKDIKQIDVKPWVIDADQMKAIKDNVYEYFGVNEDILTNKAVGDAWSAFYEGAIEPFAIQFSEVVTMCRKDLQKSVLKIQLFVMREKSFSKPLIFLRIISILNILVRNVRTLAISKKEMRKKACPTVQNTVLAIRSF